MQCPSCGASVNGAYCEYCGTKMPVERVETRSIHAENVVVNNYYYPEPQRPSTPTGSGFVGQRTATMYAGFAPQISQKSRMIAFLLCFFLGFFGAHRFYVGRYLMGVVYLFTLGLFGVGWLVDLVLVLLGKMRDRDRLPIVNW